MLHRSPQTLHALYLNSSPMQPCLTPLYARDPLTLHPPHPLDHLPLTLGLPFQPPSHLRHQLPQLHHHPRLFRMPILQPHLLNLDFALRLFFFPEDDGEGHAAGFGGFELRVEFWFRFVGEFGLWGLGLVWEGVGGGGKNGGRGYLDTGIP